MEGIDQSNNRLTLSLLLCPFLLGGKLDNINWLKDPAICTLFLNGRCFEANSCPLTHDTLGKPYVWQFKDDSQSVWQKFHPNLNESVENCFVDPANSSFMGRYQ